MSPPRSASCRRLAADEFREVIGHFASGVTVITVEHDGQTCGSTASAVSSLSLEPPMVLVCMNRSSTTGRAIAEARAFAISILAEEHHALARHFATKHPDKFAGIEVVAGPLGQPLLSDALATLECEVVEMVAGGTHTVFLAEVGSATWREGSPLAYFRGEFGRLSSEGMIDRTASGGYCVPAGTPEAFDEAIDACCAMELGAAQMTIGRVEPGDLAELRDAMQATVQHVQPGHFIDVDTSIAANTRFHETLIGMTGSAPLLAAYRRVALPGILARAFRSRISSTETDVGFGHDHRDIVEAFAAKDAPAVRQAVLDHGARIKAAYRSDISTAGTPS
jgi:flavin reductase (DIM6/NTAB) family NADH-FMN oxidoreductase RutF